MQSKIKRVLVAGLAVSAAGALGTVEASGFALPEASSAGIGTANAMVANPQELGAIPYNPAAMGFHDKSSLALGAVMIGPSFSVTNGAGRTDSQGAQWLAGPMIQGAFRITDKWRLGIGLTAPFGLETRWPYGAFPALAQTTAVRLPAPIGRVTLPTGNSPTSSKLEVLDLALTGAYRVNENLSLGAGLDVYWGRSAQLNSNLAGLNGDGTGFGFNLSALYRLNALSLGLSFRSAATVKLNGNYSPTNQYLVMLGRLQPGQSAGLDLNLPWRLQLGARYQFTPAIAAEFDWSYTGWRSFDRLVVTGSQSNALIFSDTNAWSNASAYRLGLTWQALSQTRLRFGYAYDQTGQGDAYFSARVPDTDRHLFGLGVAQDLGNGFALEASYLRVQGNNRSFQAGRVWAGGDVNGTSALNGTYRMTANVIGLEVSKTF